MYPSTGFYFNGVHSSKYGLMLYFLEDNSTDETVIWHSEVVEDRIQNQYDSLFHTLNTNNTIQKTFVVGSTEYLNADDVDIIADWLTSPRTYKWFMFDREDLRRYRYKVIVTEFSQIKVNDLPTAFKVTLSTDSQYAYERPQKWQFIVEDGQVINSVTPYINNNSSYNGYIYPRIRLRLADRFNNFAIINLSDGKDGRESRFSEWPVDTAITFSNYGKLLNNYKKAQDRLQDTKERMMIINQMIHQYNWQDRIKEFEGAEGLVNNYYRFPDSAISETMSLSIDTLRQKLDDTLHSIKTAVNHCHFEVSKPDDTENVFLKSHPNSHFLVKTDQKYPVPQEYVIGAPYGFNDILDRAVDLKYGAMTLYPLYSYGWVLFRLYHRASKLDTPWAEGEMAQMESSLSYFCNVAYAELLRLAIKYKELDKIREERQELVYNLFNSVEQYSITYEFRKKKDSEEDSENKELEKNNIVLEVLIDGKSKVITSNVKNKNVYEYFGVEGGNRNFFRLLKGGNKLKFSGSGEVEIEFYTLKKVGW